MLSSGDVSPADLGLPADVTPVFLRFRNLSAAALGQKTRNLEKFLREETFRDQVRDDWQDPGSQLWKDDAPLLWILDGLDEIIDAEARQKVSNWLDKARVNRAKDWFLVTVVFKVITSTGHRFWGPRFVQFHVQPLDGDQQQRFVESWFVAAYKKLHGNGNGDSASADEIANQLLTVLIDDVYQTGRMRELCTNPLLLTIMCIVFHENRELPDGRAELYAHCIRVLLKTGERTSSKPSWDKTCRHTMPVPLRWFCHTLRGGCKASKIALRHRWPIWSAKRKRGWLMSKQTQAWAAMETHLSNACVANPVSWLVTGMAALAFCT